MRSKPPTLSQVEWRKYNYRRSQSEGATVAMWPMSPALQEFRSALVGGSYEDIKSGAVKPNEWVRRYGYYCRTVLEFEAAPFPTLEEVYNLALQKFGTHEAVLASAHIMRDGDVGGG